MRVLIHVRSDWQRHRGGDVVQLRRWAFWLRRAGVKVELTSESLPTLAGFDLVHLNNLTRAAELLPTLEHCRAHGTPTVLTTLYWPDEDYERNGRPGLAGRSLGALPLPLRQRCKSLVRLLRDPAQWRLRGLELWRGTRKVASQLLTGTDLLLAVGNAEAGLLRVWVGDHPISIVPSGVDSLFCSNDDAAVEEESDEVVSAPETALALLELGARSGVLCVGRFDPQKGQHRLIKALRGMETRLMFVGQENPNYRGYKDYCRKLAGPHAVFLPPQNQRSLKLLYQSCMVHAQASWYELSSLSALEAAACGAAVVTAAQGCMQDYLGEHASYIQPDDHQSLRDAVRTALAVGAPPALSRTVRSRFTWQQSTDQLIAAYQQVLDRAGNSTQRGAAA